MALIRWSPFREMERFFEEEWLPHVVNAPTAFVPAIDVSETDDAVVVETPLAGADPEKVEIVIEDNVLTVRGSLDEWKEVKDTHYYRREIRTGEFVRSVTLPVSVKGAEATASSKDGLLTITIPKAEGAKPKAVTVKVTKS